MRQGWSHASLSHGRGSKLLPTAHRKEGKELRGVVDERLKLCFLGWFAEAQRILRFLHAENLLSLVGESAPWKPGSTVGWLHGLDRASLAAKHVAHMRDTVGASGDVLANTWSAMKSLSGSVRAAEDEELSWLRARESATGEPEEGQADWRVEQARALRAHRRAQAKSCCETMAYTPEALLEHLHQTACKNRKSKHVSARDRHLTRVRLGRGDSGEHDEEKKRILADEVEGLIAQEARLATRGRGAGCTSDIALVDPGEAAALEEIEEGRGLVKTVSLLLLFCVWRFVPLAPLRACEVPRVTAGALQEVSGRTLIDDGFAAEIAGPEAKHRLLFKSAGTHSKVRPVAERIAQTRRGRASCTAPETSVPFWFPTWADDESRRIARLAAAHFRFVGRHLQCSKGGGHFDRLLAMEREFGSADVSECAAVAAERGQNGVTAETLQRRLDLEKVMSPVPEGDPRRWEKDHRPSPKATTLKLCSEAGLAVVMRVVNEKGGAGTHARTTGRQWAHCPLDSRGNKATMLKKLHGTGEMLRDELPTVEAANQWLARAMNTSLEKLHGSYDGSTKDDFHTTRTSETKHLFETVESLLARAERERTGRDSMVGSCERASSERGGGHSVKEMAKALWQEMSKLRGPAC